MKIVRLGLPRTGYVHPIFAIHRGNDRLLQSSRRGFAAQQCAAARDCTTGLTLPPSGAWTARSWLVSFTQPCSAGCSLPCSAPCSGVTIATTKKEKDEAFESIMAIGVAFACLESFGARFRALVASLMAGIASKQRASKQPPLAHTTPSPILPPPLASLQLHPIWRFNMNSKAREGAFFIPDAEGIKAYIRDYSDPIMFNHLHPQHEGYHCHLPPDQDECHQHDQWPWPDTIVLPYHRQSWRASCRPNSLSFAPTTTHGYDAGECRSLLRLL